MPLLTITNVSPAPLTISELYATIPVGGSISSEYRQQWAMSNLRSLMRALNLGTATCTVTYSADEIVGMAAGLLSQGTAQISQPQSATAPAGYALSATDVGGVVHATGAGAQAFTLPDLSSALQSGRELILTIQQEGAATQVTITPGGTSQIDGAGVGVAYVATAGRKRISLISRDGLNWYSGA